MRFAHRARAGALAVALAWVASPAPARDVESYAFVRDDATLEVDGKWIRLLGVHVPDTGRDCQTSIEPVRCAPRAALALEFKIQGFVRCVELRKLEDRSWVARCYNRGEDLGGYLISRGLAVAAPGAPFDYTVLERIARHHGRGIWGVPVDVLRRP